MSDLTPKQEKFAREVASGKSQSNAYRAAFNVKPWSKATSINVNASKLMADANIRQRVTELRAPIAERAQMTLESHLADLEMLRDEARALKQHSAAIAAEIARGKASGVHVERTAATLTIESDDEPSAEAAASRMERRAGLHTVQ